MYRSTWFNDSGTMTRQFICHHLLPDRMGRLDVPLAFGDGLTDCTYLEWIRDRARRLFLILTDLGVPDQIFRVIDEGWEDDDLPIPLDQVGRLRLTPGRDVKLERDFHARQFFYLIRTLGRGQHLDYEDHELVPLDVVERRPAAGSSQDTVQLPNLPLGEVLCRRRVPLGAGAGRMSEEEFMWEINSIRDIQHPHMACYWGSYTHQGSGYVLLSPVGEYKLSAYLSNNAPPSVKNLDGPLRRRMVLDWIHCMVSTLCFAHDRGIAVGIIKPSAIAFTRDNQVVFAGPSRLTSDDGPASNHGFDRESYNYAAPERWARQGAPSAGSSRGRGPWSIPGADSNSDDMHNFYISRGLPVPTTPLDASRPRPRPRPSASASASDPQAADVFALGCVLLELLGHGLLKRSASSFAAARAARHKSPGRGGAVLDASFHRNLGQVEAWMAGLARDASRGGNKKMKKSAGGEGEKARALACVDPLLRAIESMLAASPADRPSAAQVRWWWCSACRGAAEAGGGAGRVVAVPHCAWRWEEQLGAGGPGAGASDENPDDDNAPGGRRGRSKPDVVRPSRTLASSGSFFLDAASTSGDDEWDDDVVSEMAAGSEVGSGSVPSLRSKRSASVGSGGVVFQGGRERDRDRDWWNPFGKGSMSMAMSMQNVHIGPKPKGKLWSSSGRSFTDSAVSTGS